MAIVRFHIILIAVLATLVFGWMLTGEHPWGLAGLVGADWFLINILNRITDIDEDRLNRIEGTELVARRKLVLGSIALAVLVLSLLLTVRAILWLRLLVLLIGLCYSCRLIPTAGGYRRLKDIYFLKNFASGLLFCMTCVGYPLLASGARGAAWAAVWLALFFLPFELTYEIFYDLRDLDGDRSLGVPTFPVVHGPRAARRIIDVLLLLSSLALLAGIAFGHLGLREGLMLAAPALQGFMAHRVLRGAPSSRECILLTHLGSGQLLLFLAGTWLWLRLGLPANIYL